jgi:hypothetical protein
MLTRQQNDEDSATQNRRSTPVASDFLFFSAACALASQVPGVVAAELETD